MAAEEALDRLREDAVATLSRYLRFDTTNPPGNELAAACWLRDELAQRGITSQVTLYATAPGRAVLVGRVAGTEALQPLVLNHHMDVVPAEAADWSHPPFGGEVADGYIWGRGALDTKNLGIVHLLALQQLVREGVTFRRPVIFMAVPDEEMAGNYGMRWVVENRLEELDPAWVWDEGGFTLTGLASGRPLVGVAVAEKKMYQLRLVATGEAGHGSMPHDNIAGETLVRALNRLLVARPIRINAVTEALLRRVAELNGMSYAALLGYLESGAGRDKLMNAILRDTLSLTLLHSGYKINVIPERAEAGVDCRLLPDTDVDEFRAWVKAAIADERVEVHVIESSPPTAVAPLDGPFFKAVEWAVERQMPGAAVAPLQMPGGSDARFFRELDIPAYGFGPFILDGAEIERVHGVDERISIDNLMLGIRVACDVIRKLCVE